MIEPTIERAILLSKKLLMQNQMALKLIKEQQEIIEEQNKIIRRLKKRGDK